MKNLLCCSSYHIRDLNLWTTEKFDWRISCAAHKAYRAKIHMKKRPFLFYGCFRYHDFLSLQQRILQRRWYHLLERSLLPSFTYIARSRVSRSEPQSIHATNLYNDNRQCVRISMYLLFQNFPWKWSSYVAILIMNGWSDEMLLLRRIIEIESSATTRSLRTATRSAPYNAITKNHRSV